MKQENSKTSMEDFEIMIYIMDHYSPELNNATALLKNLRKVLKKSCSQERFRVQFNRYLKEYADSEK